MIRRREEGESLWEYLPRELRAMLAVLWKAWYWRSWRNLTALELEERRVLARCGELRRQWLRLAEEDRNAGVAYDSPTGAGHLAYEAYEAECMRLYDLPTPEPRPYGWLGSDGSLHGSVEHWGGLSGARGGYSVENAWPAVRPVTRRQAYRAMGWKYEPPPTEEELAAMHKAFKAMARINTEPYTQRNGKMTFVTLGAEYFREYVANLHEIESEEMLGLSEEQQ